MFPLEDFQTTLAKAVAIFQTLGIRFHLTGGVTSIAWGEPRMTQDVDIVVDNDAAVRHLDELIQSLLSVDFLLDEGAVRDAVASKRMFQLLDLADSLKLDIYPRELIPNELQRSVQREVFEGVYLPIASLSDAAVSKLIWVSKGSHKNRRDVRQIVRRANDSEEKQIERLALSLNLAELLQEVLSESDEIE